MIISKVHLRHAPGTQGTLAKVLLEGAISDRGHGLIWSLFGATGEETRAFLYRQIDAGSFITVSQRAPEDTHNLWCIESKDYAPALQVDQRLRFVLRANPVMAARKPSGKRGARVDAIMHAKAKLAHSDRRAFQGVEDAALDWLGARGAVFGAEFDREHSSATGYQQVAIRKRGAPNAVRFSEIDFEGVLTVTDPERLSDALFKGVGKAKSYGCGLLLVRPA